VRGAFLFAVLAMIALLLQTSVLPRAAIGRATPDLLLIMCVYLGLQQHSVSGAIGAFVLGYLQDIFSGSVAGLNAFAMCIVFALVYLTSRRLWVDNVISKVVLVFLASVIKTAIILSLVAVFMSPERWSGPVLSYALLQALFAAALSPFVFAILTRSLQPVVEEED
jgi:rod shape-determining protein MreD